MWFQHDGAPEHFSHAIREHLDQTHSEKWIRRDGSTPWPPRSPDLTPLDFFLRGHTKNFVYKTPAESEEDFIARILAVP